ncbi:Exodeoxyribonuclease 7 small subunit [Desulfovibrio sp. X2]|uniref:exodeoxyribonuclease VII small subunit n=1 Tax=Desulfovibrio sp. X2 TaxID=941449 RepID=UPI0003587630|nr:exodeoxyribonuclease VII small subunit [Desulfovibrio sp. X2]EPR37525.1 Exodeoxyribonuclease 7 small subunit [Desulfovibrio sp. X2]
MSENAENFEKRLERLGAIVERLEQGELPLEQGVALYKEGLALAKACREQLDAARNEVRIYQDGLLKDFANADSAGAEGAGGVGE